MILYIHGFGGSGEGVKAKAFREYFKNKDKFIAPSLSYVPNLAISTLKEIIKNCQNEKINLIGSSLGGFYAIYLAHLFNLKSLLINPSIYPWETLERFTKEEKRGLNFYDLSYFEFNNIHLESLKAFRVKNIKKDLFFLLLQKDDDVIDYKIAFNIFKGAKVILDEGGGHSFENINDYFLEIEKFFKE